MSEKQLEDFWNRIKNIGMITGCWQGMEYKPISEFIEDDLTAIFEAAALTTREEMNSGGYIVTQNQAQQIVAALPDYLPIRKISDYMDKNKEKLSKLSVEEAAALIAKDIAKDIEKTMGYPEHLLKDK